MEVASVVSVQNRYNVGDRDSDPVVDWCQERGIAFLPWRPVAGGEARRVLGGRADASGVEASPTQLALAWLLHRAPVVLPIPGTSSVAHLRENVEAAALKLTEEQAEALSEGG
jgi:aryl-alcohol dehydrogenase-like predicted oxidoreductase